MSVNLSRSSLYFENVVKQYRDIVDEAGILPELVPIEITESITIDNQDIKELAEEFYQAGFPLHIDDFGEGTYKHSNRSYSGQYVGVTNKGYFGCPYIEGAESEWLLVPQNGCIFFRGYFDCHPLT